MTRSPDGLPPLSEVIRAHALSARKGLSQNFILDLNLTRRIAREAGPFDNVPVVEIGPGPGGLTRALLMEGADKVYAVERDPRCIPVLEDIAAHYPGRLEVIEGDALELDWPSLAPSPLRIVANLPYGIATELLVQWLTVEAWPPFYDRMVLMFQREVAERIVSAPGNKNYGRLSVLAQWRTKARIVMTLPPQAFTPPPKVESCVVEFQPITNPEPAGSVNALQKIVAAAFGQRRKMLRQSLKTVSEDPDKLLAAAGIDPSLRAEALTVFQFCTLAKIWRNNEI